MFGLDPFTQSIFAVGFAAAGLAMLACGVSFADRRYLGALLAFVATVLSVVAFGMLVYAEVVA